jgi:hypothetical protein
MCNPDPNGQKNPGLFPGQGEGIPFIPFVAVGCNFLFGGSALLCSAQRVEHSIKGFVNL